MATKLQPIKVGSQHIHQSIDCGRNFQLSLHGQRDQEMAGNGASTQQATHENFTAPHAAHKLSTHISWYADAKLQRARRVIIVSLGYRGHEVKAFTLNPVRQRHTMVVWEGERQHK